MRAPVGIVEIKALYGDPILLMRDDGTPSPIWESRMVKVALPRPLPLGWQMDVMVSSARVNQAIAAECASLFTALKASGAWDHIVTFDGAYAWRSQRGSAKLSMHSFGGALDFNAATNRLGERGDMHPLIVDVFDSQGWEWGGRWRRPDPMHVQFARDY